MLLLLLQCFLWRLFGFWKIISGYYATFVFDEHDFEIAFHFQPNESYHIRF